MGTNSDMGDYLENLKNKMDAYVHFVYKISRSFPKEELYGSNSQFRRATLSIILNFIEGYARKRQAVKLNFWETSYGSLKESKYLLCFAFKENWITQIEYEQGLEMAEEIGAMLWKATEALKDA